MFGMMNVVDALANGDITKWKEVKAMSYNEAFLKMKKNMEEAEYRKRYQKSLELNRKNK